MVITSSRFAEMKFHPVQPGVEVKFRPDKAGQFSIWHLFRFVYNFFEFFFVTMLVYETENAWISIDFNFFLLELFRFLFIK